MTATPDHPGKTATDARLPRRRAGLVHASRGDRHTLTDPASGAVNELNDTALALWELCDGHTTATEMAEGVAALFGLQPAQADREVRRALAELDRCGLLDWVGR